MANTRKSHRKVSRKSRSSRKVSRKSRSSRKVSRKSDRKSRSSRKASRSSRKSRTSRKSQRGGANESLAQGADFLSKHMNQHGGALVGAPVGSTGMLPDELRMAARIGVLDDSIRATAGMRDQDNQTGGSRKSKSKKSKAKKSKKSKSKKSKKSKKSRQSGGARYEGAELSASPMLLTPSQAARAGTADFSTGFAK